jgi:hypothetical protein
VLLRLKVNCILSDSCFQKKLVVANLDWVDLLLADCGFGSGVLLLHTLVAVVVNKRLDRLFLALLVRAFFREVGCL